VIGKIKNPPHFFTVQRIVEKVIHHTSEIFEIRLSRYHENFYPGQYISIVSDQPSIYREYSIASGTTEPYFSFLIRQVPGGKITQFLSHLQPQETITTSLPVGNFRPGFAQKNGDFIFIATGTGIAPFVSYLKSYPNRPPRQILYGVRYLTEAIVLPELKKHCPTQLAISREKIAGHHYGHVTDLLDRLSKDSNIHYYLCGLQNMIQEVTSWLKQHGVSTTQIHQDNYSFESLESRLD